MTSTVEASGLWDLDARSTLDTVLQCAATAARAEAGKLAAVVHFADLHPVREQGDVAATWTVQADLSNQPVGPPISGEGAPQVREDAVDELSAALGISYQAALALVGESLELRHRLPRLWRLVQDLVLPAWQGRRAAAETTRLSREAAAFADGQLAVAARRGRLPRATVAGVVDLARARFEPSETRTDEEQALASRGVWFDLCPESVAVTDLRARLDTLDARALEVTIADLAGLLGRLGDADPLEVRRATALGMLADPQHSLDLLTGDTESGHPRPTRQGPSATLFVHVDAADLAHQPGSGGRVERLGAATLDLLADWLARVGTVRVQPVLDPSRTDSVDAHDPPPWMQTLVVLRDRHCVFPGCRVDARSGDLDHIEPYRSPDDGGPPGQTHPDNLAPLCRRHHNRKTHYGWTYTREADGYHWTSPAGRSHVVPHLDEP